MSSFLWLQKTIQGKKLFLFRKPNEIDEKVTPEIQKEKIEQIKSETYKISRKDRDDRNNFLMEENLKKFDEDRKKFELEKLKFLEEKKDFEKIRLQKFERYRKQVQEQKNGEAVGKQIENVKLARRLIIDYKEADGTKKEELNVTFEPQILSENPKEHEAEKIKQENGDSLICDTSSAEKNLNPQEVAKTLKTISDSDIKEISLFKFLQIIFVEAIEIWKIHKAAKNNEWLKIKSSVKKCLSELIILIIFCGIGGMTFKFIEGNSESMYKCGVKRVKREFIDQLWMSSHNLRSVKSLSCCKFFLFAINSNPPE